MVSADNLNFDVLELIFTFLSGNDLPSLALVSKSFLAAVTPRLYRTISYRFRQSKGYNVGNPVSPFSVIVTHSHLAAHVREIELRSVPTLKNTMHPGFIRDCKETLRLCRNLKKFRCTIQNVLPVFLPVLEEKKSLDTLRVYANLTTAQAGMLAKITGVRTLSLEFASWNVVDVLPAWTKNLSNLTSLTLYMINDLHESIYETIVGNLPHITGLHVVGCPKIDHTTVLRNASKTPLLQSLSFTTTESTKSLDLPPPHLPHLKHLALDTKYSMQPSPSPAILSALLTHLKYAMPNLASFAMKMPERKISVGDAFIDQLLLGHKHSLRRLAFLDCAVNRESIAKICEQCIHLERLDVAVPIKDISAFSVNIAKSKTLHTIVDVQNHVDHGIRPTLTQVDANLMMAYCPSLKAIVTGGRIWTGRGAGAGDNLSVRLEKRPSHRQGALWFIPRE
ncbi:hypothetical protein D9613_010997 [Agrocybe pediades]|uniref:F-box domain-containing protein n=1 Tax=Agrocybe pediades TaxID=84607 RepID=A0A8H4QL16_9AGAR|nr:hypothetical protein D9613_010997 [Agrocybe pediades]KAF9556836.1 hypothetical protein CPC08DRAFT_693944 [Agrocybe pediades]